MNEKSKNNAYGKSSLPIINLGIVSIVLLLAWLCLGINVDFRDRAKELERAENTWEAHNITDYEMTVSLFSMAICSNISMIIEHNQVVSMLDLGCLLGGSQYPVALLEEPAWYTEAYADSSFLPPTLQDFEVLHLFEHTEEHVLPESQNPISLCNSEGHYEVLFNSEYGYVEEINSTSCPSWNVGLGLLCPIVSDCQAGFRIVDFIPQ